jgi:hypothetical protein
VSEQTVTLGDGTVLPLVQAQTLAEKLQLAEASGDSHWHVNRCGCCYTVHGADFAWVVGPDGGANFYAGRGCGCSKPGET